LPAAGFTAPAHQLDEYPGGGLRVAEGGMGRLAVQAELRHQPGQARRLTGRQLEHQPGQGRRVQDRMSQRGPQPATQQPGVEGVVAVLYQHRPPGEAEKGAAGVAELGRPDQHRSVDQVAAPGIGIDRRPAVD
jgi:hypothetical protein